LTNDFGRNLNNLRVIHNWIYR